MLFKSYSMLFKSYSAKKKSPSKTWRGILQLGPRTHESHSFWWKVHPWHCHWGDSTAPSNPWRPRRPSLNPTSRAPKQKTKSICLKNVHLWPNTAWTFLMSWAPIPLLESVHHGLNPLCSPDLWAYSHRRSKSRNPWNPNPVRLRR